MYVCIYIYTDTLIHAYVAVSGTWGHSVAVWPLMQEGKDFSRTPTCNTRPKPPELPQTQPRQASNVAVAYPVSSNCPFRSFLKRCFLPLAMDESRQMTLAFTCEAETVFGQEVRVVGSTKEFGAWNPALAPALKTDASTYPRWSGFVNCEACKGQYKFVIFSARDGQATWEQGDNRCWSFSCDDHVHTTAQAELLVSRFGVADMTGPRIMSWKTSCAPDERAVPVPSIQKMQLNEEVLLDVYCNETSVGDTVIVVGSCEELGKWNPDNGLKLCTSHETFPRWSGSVHLKSADIEFKLMIVNVEKNSAEWETSQNRRFLCPPCKEGLWQVACWWNNSCCKVQATEASGKSMRGKQDADAARARAAFMPTARDTDSDTFAATTSATSPQRRTGPAQMIPQASEYPMQKQPRTMTTTFGGASPQRSTSFSPLLAEQWARRENCCPSSNEQHFCFKMKNVEEKDAKKIQVELVFQEQRPAITLNMENYDAEEQQAAWLLAAPTTDWTPGFHFFGFRVNGVFMLSAEHMRLGHWNVMHLNDPLRRYLLARDSRGQLSHGAPILETRRAKQIVDMATDSFVASGSIADTVGLQKLARHSKIARPYFVSGNLLSSTHSDDTSAHNSFRPFCSAVYEGLFDRELILRMDGVVLPEPPMPPTGTEPLDECKLRLWGGAHSIKKAHGKCEDAYFLAPHGIGIADGVGCFTKFEQYGVNAAEYATQLMQFACLALQPEGRASARKMGHKVAERAALAVAEAESRAEAFGGSTIAVLCQHNSQIGVANLGDSGFVLLRRGMNGMRIAMRSQEQQHVFNCPYQLTRLPAVPRSPSSVLLGVNGRNTVTVPLY